MASKRSDEELMAAYVRGDRAAFRQLFDRYQPLLQRVLVRDLDRPEEARDLVQQTFLQLHRARADYRSSKPLRPWLMTIALNLKRQYFRHRSRRPQETSELSEEMAAAGSVEPTAVAEAARLRDALRQLSETQRDAIVLHWYEGFTFTEIAQIVGAKPSAVKVRAHRGYERLRQLLGDTVTMPGENAYSG